MIDRCSLIIVFLTAPTWSDGSPFPECKPATCQKYILPILVRLTGGFISRSVPPASITTDYTSSSPDHLMNVVCPYYLKPDQALLQSAHLAVAELLPEGDCESMGVVRIARSYIDHWRPRKTRVILLAESHAATERDYVFDGPRLCDRKMPKERYNGPRDFIRLVYCLTYGENEALIGETIPNNKGTPQFWSLFAACSRGVDYLPKSVSSSKQTASKFAGDLLKGGGLSVEDRLKAKLEVLEDLRERGIWLIDTSIFGWYISQPQVTSFTSESVDDMFLFSFTHTNI